MRFSFRGNNSQKIAANWISSDGKFANDTFISQLLKSNAPKLMHDQLRQANYPYSEGKRSTTARPLSQLTSKVKSTKGTITEEVVKEHFPKALPVPLITKGVIAWLEDEMLFTPRQTLHANCCCAGDTPLKFANAEKCFLGQHISLGGIAGLPAVESCKVIARRATLYGCKMVVSYQSHCSVSANGTFDFIELDDKGTDIRIESQCCQPAIQELNKIIFSQRLQPAQADDKPMPPTVSVKMSDVTPLEPPQTSEIATLRGVLQAAELRLQHTAKPPLIELPTIIYEEIRQQLIQSMVPLVDIPTLFIGGIHIHTPPEIDDYIHICNVDLLRSRAVRNRKNGGTRSDEGKKTNGDGEYGDNIPTPRSVYDSDEDDASDEDDGATSSSKMEMNNGSKNEEKANAFTELDNHMASFYRSISKRIIAFEAKKRGTAGVKQGVETASDRRRKRKQQVEDKQKHASDKCQDDWNIQQSDNGQSDNGKNNQSATVAEAKLTKWFIYFRWSRIVRRTMEYMKHSEIADDWNLDDDEESMQKEMSRGGSNVSVSTRKHKKKMGKLFLTLRWNRLVKKALRTHERKERREDLHYY